MSTTLEEMEETRRSAEEALVVGRFATPAIRPGHASQIPQPTLSGNLTKATPAEVTRVQLLQSTQMLV